MLRGNSIFQNVSLGIDLATDGVTPNDVGDADAFANLQQNFPIITTASNELAGTTVIGTLNSATNAGFILDFYSNVAVDGSGNGEGQVYLGSPTSPPTAPATRASPPCSPPPT